MFELLSFSRLPLEPDYKFGAEGVVLDVVIEGRLVEDDVF